MAVCFALTSAARHPTLKKGQMTVVYEALTPYPEKWSLEQLAERCAAKGYEFKHPLPAEEGAIFLRQSITFHLQELKKRDIIRVVL
jgi:hypothetical protein